MLLPLVPMLAGVIDDHSDFGFPGTRRAGMLQVLSLTMWIVCITPALGAVLRGRTAEPFWTAGGIAFLSLFVAWPVCYVLMVVVVEWFR